MEPTTKEPEMRHLILAKHERLHNSLDDLLRIFMREEKLTRPQMRALPISALLDWSARKLDEI